jgi:hypothetical protein
VTTVNERSTVVFTFDFTDETGAAVIPTAATWTLTDETGAVINGRSAVVLVPASSVSVTLSGADTALRSPGDDGLRRVAVQATYNSSYGTGLTLNREAAFTVVSLAAVAPTAGAEGQLARLARLLAEMVPASGGVPTVAQYRQAARDAVADFGYRCPRTLYGTLSVVAGTAAYALPAGFQRLIDLEALTADTYRTPDGFLAAFDAAASPVERHVISGATITFYPTPAYTLARGLWYAAGYPYDAATDAFTGLTADAERIVLLKAQAAALRTENAATAASRGVSYQIGDTTITRHAAQPQAQLALELEAAYADACRAQTGFIGYRGEYTGWEAWR